MCVPDKLCLPDDIRETVRTFARASAQVRRALAHALQDYMTEYIGHGQKMAIYELLAAEWNDVTGENISARTMRHWLHSVSDYSVKDLKEFAPLTDAQLIEAVKLASDCQNGATPQQICEWTIVNAVDSVPAMRAHWLPQTSQEYEIDPPYIAAIKRTANRFFAPNDSRWTRFNALLCELRELLSNPP